MGLFLTAFFSDFALREFWRGRPKRTFRTVAVERLKHGPVDVIFVGSSHIYTGINPDRFSIPVVNLADSALNYEMAEVLCHKYWDRVIQAKLPVIELDAVPVYEDTIARRDSDFRNFFDWDLKAIELPLLKWQRCKAVVGQYAAPLRFGNLSPKSIQVKSNDDRRIGPGFHARTGKLNRREREAFFDELGPASDEYIVSRNLAALQRLLTDLNQVGVEWRILRPPFHREYWIHDSSAMRESYADRASTICAKLSPINAACIIDCSRFQSDRDDYFADWTHLSAVGADAFSQHLVNGSLLHRY